MVAHGVGAAEQSRGTVPNKLLQLPGLNHSVRQVRVLLSAVLRMQLKMNK